MALAQARNNGELLANLGNFVNRVLKFVDARCVYASIVKLLHYHQCEMPRHLMD
jgi:methionyl-tRNA synthetase